MAAPAARRLLRAAASPCPSPRCWAVPGDRGSRRQGIDACLRTLLVNVHRIDAGYCSTYDMQRKKLVRYYYQKNVYVPHKAVQHRRTDEAIFDEHR